MAAQPEKPAAQPTYVLRGHAAQIHAVHFFRDNTRLLTGDADGWVVSWNITTKRAVAVWKAHPTTILGVGSWDDDRIITHGRDNKLQVWRIKLDDEASFSTTLPIDDASSERKLPWLLHSLPVNAINFCAFAACRDSADTLLLATPGVHDGGINVMSLPSETRRATIRAPAETATGMLMAVGLHVHGLESSSTSASDATPWLVFAGYESGHVGVWQRQRSSQQQYQLQQQSSPNEWKAIYLSHAHTQPVLSLALAPGLGSFFTSSADAIVAQHPMLPTSEVETRTVQTRHAGQQSIVVRSDEKIFATAGWDGRVRVYSATSMSELAVLKYHKDGCYALAFAEIMDGGSSDDNSSGDGGALIKREYTVSALRMRRAKTTHWIAAGSKDGKVSLWDIY